MRKHSQKLSVLFILTALLIATLAFVLVACNGGGQDDHSTHTPDSDVWHTDETSHWHECVEGGEKISEGAHDFVLKSDNEHHYLECSVCKKTKDYADHVTVVKYDADGHWVECTKEGCTFKTQSQQHDLGAQGVDNGDGNHTLACTYEGCGYQKIEAHALSKASDGDGTHHDVCSACAYVGSPEQCVPAQDAEYTDLKDELHHTFECDVCGDTVTKEHTLGAWRSDGTNHYKQCSDCEAQVQKSAHAWEDHTDDSQHWQTCATCSLEQGREDHTQLVWKDSADHKQHYKGCANCDHDFGDLAERGDHVDLVWTDDAETDTCTATCSSCNLTMTYAHDYTDSVDCIRCQHNPQIWEVAINNDENTYSVTKYAAFNQVSADVNAPTEIVFPKYYQGHDITGAYGKTSQAPVLTNSGTQRYYTLVFPEGYTTIGENFATTGTTNCLCVTIPSTMKEVKSYIGNSSNSQDLQTVIRITDLSKYLELTLTNNVLIYSRGTDQYHYHIATEDGYEEIRDLVIPAGTTELKKGVFAGAHFDSLSLPTGFATFGNQSSSTFAAKLIVPTLKDYLAINFVGSNPLAGGAELSIDGVEIGSEWHIEEGVTQITARALSGLNEVVYDAFKNVEKLYFPSTLTSYGINHMEQVAELHFYSLQQARDVNYSKSFGNFFYGDNGLRVFIGEQELTSLVLDDSITYAGNDAGTWAYNDSLTSVKFESEDCTKISYDAFYACKNLASLDFGSHIASIGRDAFAFTGLKGAVRWPETATTVSCAFNNCGISALIIPAGVTTINNGAFNGYTCDIIFDKNCNITSFGQTAFAGTQETDGYLGERIVLPATGIDNLLKKDAFKQASNLKKVFYLGGETQFAEYVKTASTNGGNDALVNANVYYYQESDLGEDSNQMTWHYSAEGLVEVWDKNEPDCPQHHFEIKQDQKTHYYQCSECSYKLQAADHIQSESYATDGETHYHVCEACGYKLDEPAAHTAKEGEYGKDGDFHWSVCEVCGAKMESTAQSHNLGSEATKPTAAGHTLVCTDCGQEVVVEHSYNMDGDGFVDGICTVCNYSHIVLDATGLISDYTGVDIEKLKVPASINGKDVTGIAAGNSSASIFKDGCGLKEIILPDSEKFTIINKYAFAGLSTLEHITIGNHVTKIDQQAFRNTTSLEELIVPDSVTTLGTTILAGSAAKKVVLGTGITTYKSLGSLSQLEELHVKGQLTSISGAFPTTTLGTYVYMDTTSFNAVATKASESIRNSLKNVIVFCLHETDPGDSVSSEYVDGYFHINAETQAIEFWNAVLALKSTSIEVDLATIESATKTVDLKSAIGISNRPLAWSVVLPEGKDSVEGVTVNNDGIVTVTKLGNYNFKVNIQNDEESAQQISLRVWSSDLYVTGTVGGQAYTEKAQDNVFENVGGVSGGDGVQFLYKAQAGDTFKINLADIDFAFDKSIFDADNSNAAEKKINVADDGTISVTDPALVQVFVTYYDNGRIKYTVDVVRYVKIAIVGRDRCAALGTIVEEAFVIDDDEGKVFQNLKMKLAGKDVDKAYYDKPCIQVVVTDFDGNQIIYDANGPSVSISGDLYDYRYPDAEKWGSTRDKCDFQLGGTMSAGRTWTFTFTFDAQDALKYVYIANT